MKINPINQIGYQSNFYTKNNANKKIPTFQADYDNKPVPPIGKAVAAASVVALISAMTYTTKYDMEKDKQIPDLEQRYDEVSSSSYQPKTYKEEPEILTPEKKQKPEKNQIMADTTSKDTTSHIKDLTIKQEDLNTLINEGNYKIIAKGDTIELIPADDATKISHETDTTVGN